VTAVQFWQSLGDRWRSFSYSHKWLTSFAPAHSSPRFDKTNPARSHIVFVNSVQSLSGGAVGGNFHWLPNAQAVADVAAIARRSAWFAQPCGPLSGPGLANGLAVGAYPHAGCGVAGPGWPSSRRWWRPVAAHMVADAHLGTFDVAMLISGDSDLVPPVDMVANMLNRRVVATFPPRRKSHDLRRAAGASIDISRAALRSSQLAGTVVLPNGMKAIRPTSWR
jgi:hypothetical protein